MSSFTAEIYQNEYLPVDGTQVNAIVTVTCTGGGPVADAPEAAEVVIVDTSGSMDVPRSKIKAARHATAVAIDCIRDGVMFGVIAGTDQARLVYPAGPSLVLASDLTRAQAKSAVARLSAGGGTAIGSWLTLARAMFETTPGRVCHAILLTDGQNRETARWLDRALAECEGRFQCDCRGVGTDWRVEELRRVASALLGTVDIIARPEDMAEDFRSLMQTAMGKATHSVSLRLWTPQGARVAFVRQVAPTIEELTARASSVNALTADYPTGTWGEESRDYHVCVNVPLHNVGDEMLAARVSLVEDETVAAQGLVRAIWTDDERLSTQIDRQVAHYTGQAELASSIQEGLDARKMGDEARAEEKLGNAVRIASETGHDGTLRLLEAVVEIEDAPTGTVRLRREVADADEMALDTRSTRTVRTGERQ